jgi:F-type H+-transporting ATPase subunit gamma
MKLVAASKLRRTQNAIVSLRPYASKLQEILVNLSGSLDNTEEAAFTAQRPVQKVLLIILTSNRGLCGPFNSNIIKAARAHITANYEELNRQGHLELMCIGRKGAEFFRKNKYNVVNANTDIFDKLTFDNVVVMAEELMAQFASRKYDRIEIIYNQFKNAAVQILKTEQYLPIIPPAETAGKAHASDFLFEPEKKVLVRELIPKTLKIQLYKVILDSFASEHGARMTAMNQATENAQEILKDLRLSYNKARQAAITKELLEIVSGAEALKG